MILVMIMMVIMIVQIILSRIVQNFIVKVGNIGLKPVRQLSRLGLI